jgi:hypothetical protein
LPSLSNHQSNDVTKVLLLGDAKSGKTTSLVSLVEAGYKLRILDFDNLLDPLKQAILDACPDKLSNVEYVTLRDKRKASATGSVIDGQPKAFITGVKMIDHWKDGDTDLGKPAEWDKDCILVIDSLSRLCDAAYDFRESIASRGKSGEVDGRAVYGDAQDAIESLLAHITTSTFRTNLIVICHGQSMELPDGKKIFPQGVGQKLSPKIPQYFPVYIRVVNKAGKRSFQITSSSLIDLAYPKPSAIHDDLSTDDGLAKLFASLRASPAKPKSLTLRRIPA